jgi:hypothetical protein
MLVAAPVARATFHQISIREVYPGSTAQPDSGYFELQMYSAGQALVKGHALTVYDAAGAAIGSFAFGANVPNSANQQTILIGDSGVQSAFGVAPDLTASGFEIPPAGGAACWAGTLDCVSWGNFSGSTASPSGSPADPSGIPDGMALRRTIEPHCATLLEGADDSNSAAADFFDATPEPRDNASAIAEVPCIDTTPPEAPILDSHPADPSSGASAAFTYHSTELGSSFECSLAAGAGGEAFSFCPLKGKTYTGLAAGNYTFKVRAKDAAGNVGPATAFEWTVDNSLADTTPPDTAIDSAPPDPSGVPTATFTYHSTEPGSSYECRLDAAAYAGCSAAGIEYTGLANGSHTFLVRAIDPSENVDPTAAGYTFVVAVPPPSEPEAQPPPAIVPPPIALYPLAPKPPPRHHRRRRHCRHRNAHRNGRHACHPHGGSGHRVR